MRTEDSVFGVTGALSHAKLKDNQVPSYRLHKQSGQAIVTLNGRDILLGKYGSASSKAEYRRRTAEWLASKGIAPTSPAWATT
jgi:hypothetical protein